MWEGTNHTCIGEGLGNQKILAEAALLEQLRSGSSYAAEQFVRQHGGWMLAVANRLLGDQPAAEDCVQEAFLNAFQKIDTFEARSTLKSWLHRIVVNAALMKLRTRRRANEQPIDTLLPEFDRNDCRIEARWNRLETPVDILQRSQVRELILSKINELPEDYRIVLLLRDIEELSTREAAEILACSDGTVRVRLHRARAALKKLLEPMLRGEE